MRNIRSILSIFTGLWVVALFCCGCSQSHKAKKTAATFLKAYYTDLDFEKAKALATEPSFEIIDGKEEITQLNPYAKKEAPAVELKEFKRDKKNTDKAVYSYTVNRAEKKLHLTKVEGVWKADLAEERRERDAEMSSLSKSRDEGLAAAASGPIKYKKRRQSN